MVQDYSQLMQDTFDNIVRIGAGGGGSIFKAHHKRLDKDVVLKKIHSSQISNIDRRGELNILKNLKHSYIPQVFDFIEYGDEVFTIMEYIPGQSFAQLFEQKRKFSQKEVMKWLTQLCEVVTYLHSQNPPIIHCDIKPANIMLTPEGNICLIDFNISGVKSEEGIASIGYTKAYAPVEQFAVVTRRFDAPVTVTPVPVPIKNPMQQNQQRPVSTEQTELLSGSETTVLLGDSERTELLGNNDRTEVLNVAPAPKPVPKLMPVQGSPMRNMTDDEWKKAKAVQHKTGKNLWIDERTDIYSIGATMYHILTGNRPMTFYEKQVPISTVKKSVSESLAQIIEKAMEVAPENRFKSCKQMLKLVQSISTIDKRYKALARKQMFTGIFMGVMIIVSLGCVMLGKSTMEQEKEDLYNDYIAQMEDAREERDYEALEEAYVSALEISKQNPDAYNVMGLAYYDQKKYEECINYLSQEVYTNGDVLMEAGDGSFYYITASCFFELEDYTQAVLYYEKALQLQPEEIAYYRDYIIALARSGDLEKAEDTLAYVEKEGIEAAQLSLLRGEIALLCGELEQSESNFLDCIAATEDAYVKLRAYTKLDEVYQAMYVDSEQYDKRIASLQEALQVLPQEDQITLMEKLAQVYIDYSDIKDTEYYCNSAIEIFKQMEQRNYGTFTSKYNIAVLYEKIGKLDEAKAQLNDMLTAYKDNYIVYKRLAFLELNIQSTLENEQRDYAVFKGYYDSAFTLYKENVAKEDVEMLSLQQLYDELVSYGWIEE